MPNRKPRAHIKTQSNSTAPPGPPTVSARWLAAAIGITLVAAVACAWAVLCFIFWQGSWQLLFHPTKAVTRTPASAGMAFESIDFDSTEAGVPQLHGWWIPNEPGSCYTVLYLHGADGNLGDTVDDLIPLREAGLNIFAFDYRGYGLSHFNRPSEAHWREDAESAIGYLTGTRHIPAQSLILVGKNLGANLALEVAAAHPELAAVVLDQPLDSPVSAIFNDPRARLVPAHALVHDRFDLNGPSANLHIPSLWVYAAPARGATQGDQPAAYQKASGNKALAWLTNPKDASMDLSTELTRWLADLSLSSNASR